jgi:hypothetical protein
LAQDIIVRPHTRTDNELFKLVPSIGCTGFTIFTYLNMRENRRSGRCDPSLTRIAKDLGLDKKTVIKYLDILEEFELIDRIARYTKIGRRMSNQYNLFHNFWERFFPSKEPEADSPGYWSSGKNPPPLQVETFHPRIPPLDCGNIPSQQSEPIDQTCEPSEHQKQCAHPPSLIRNPGGHHRFCGSCYLPLNDEVSSDLQVE